MDNNEVMRGVRFALHLKNSDVLEMFTLAGHEITLPDVAALLKKEDAPGYIECSASVLHYFLDGLIVKRRGPHDGPKPKIDYRIISNNMILRKLRIAFHLKDTDVIAILKSTGFNLSKSELGAMSRKVRHSQYMKCGDQVLRYFLKGLVYKYRKDA